MSENNRTTPECDESAVWLHKTKSGDTFLSIKVVIGEKEFRTIAFKNKKRSNDKSPNFFFKNSTNKANDDSL